MIRKRKDCEVNELKPISNRYEPKRLLGPLHGGKLYRGKDSSLQRSVFIYAVQLQGEEAAAAYIGKLGSAAQQGATDSPFLHVLDIEVGQGCIHVIISYKPGLSFEQFVHAHAPSFRDTVEMIANLGESLLEAAEERQLNFSLEPGNIWIADDGTINLINTWDRPASPTRLSKGLSQLFVQLATRSKRIPSSAESFQADLLRTLDLPARQKEEVIAAVTDAWKERITLASFVQAAKSWLPLPAPAGYGGEPPAASSAKFDAYPNFEARSVHTKKALRAQPPLRSRWFRAGKKIWIGLSLSAVGLAVSAGAFVLLVEILHGGDKTKPADPVVVEHRPQPEAPPNTAEAKAKETPVSVAPVVADPDKPPVIDTPTLTGLSKEAAEKAALDSGLRYTYYLEPASQPAGTVFKQEPGPGERVEKGSRVLFWISKGPTQ